MSEGWKCPACGGAHSPSTESCPVFAPKRTLFPYVPESIPVPYAPNEYIITYC